MGHGPNARRLLDQEACYRALTARDVRFDGTFFVGVSTTGIYCRPICTARIPGKDRCSFYRSAVEAEHAGFRACFRCRPELAPGAAPLDSIPRLVTRAVARIEEGFLNERSIEDLAGELRVTSRHLRRAMEDELGVGPIELAQSRRLALAKQLLQSTKLGLAEVAHASGFRSVRRFNALFGARFGRPPSSLRKVTGASHAARELLLTLDYRPPLDWEAMLAFLGARAIPGVERVDGTTYRRTVRIGAREGRIEVTKDPKRDALVARVSLSLAGVLMSIAARLRTVFDLDAQPEAISAHLAGDPLLRPLVRSQPGLRVPGAFDSFEMTVRAVLGQQVSVRAATTLAGRLVERFGTSLEASGEEEGQGPARLFPPAERVAEISAEELGAIGITRARARSLLALARAVADRTLSFERGAAPDETIAQLEGLPGFGAWTSHYVAMRALHWPDAFVASDLGVKKALGGLSPGAAEKRAEAWRPWRAYAVMHLWRSL